MKFALASNLVMDSKNIFTILIFVQVVLLTTAFNMEKPGTCMPWNSTVGPCITSCKNDWDCNGLQKCCSVGCGLMCQNPCPVSCDGITCTNNAVCTVVNGCAQCQQPTQSSQQKQGVCTPFSRPLPKDTSPPARNCKKYCYTDAECTGTTKCCSIGCSNLCISVCSSVCDDVNCDTGKECKVVSGCAQCVPGSQEKPGKCMKWQSSGPCVTNCDKDYDCTGSRKCCSIGCGKICQDPCPTSCDQLPPCLSGNTCQVVNECAQCVPESS